MTKHIIFNREKKEGWKGFQSCRRQLLFENMKEKKKETITNTRKGRDGPVLESTQVRDRLLFSINQ